MKYKKYKFIKGNLFLTCERCKKYIPQEEGREGRYEEKQWDFICEDCWDQLESWIFAKVRHRLNEYPPMY